MVPKETETPSSLESVAKTSSEGRMDPSDDSEGYFYLTADAKRKLPNYQYRGTDLSLLYAYVLSPLAAFCVEKFVPRTMAPNTITLTGLTWMISAYVIYWYYVPNLEIHSDDPDPPRWMFLWNTIAMLGYQTLDNMDGKQARRTKSSSPLGLLFDHGCDAINSIFGSANWIIAMGLLPRDNLFLCWALIFGPFSLFYFSTWEQYYTGELIMPIMNGPNEGLFGGAMLSLASWWFGHAFWQSTEWYDMSVAPFLMLPEGWVMRNCDFVILLSCIGFVQETLIKTLVVSPKYKGSLAGLAPFFTFSLCFLVIGYFECDVWLSIPRTSLHLAMFLQVEVSTELMLAHITGQHFNPWGRWHILPLIALTAWVAYRGSQDSALIEYWVITYTWSLGAYLLLKIVLVIHEICHVLGVWCFDIVTPHPRRQLVEQKSKTS